MTDISDPGADHLQQGLALEQQGDSAGAEAAYAVADQAGSRDGALFLGVLLKRRGDLAGVRHEWQAYERALVGDTWSACDPSPKLVALRRQLLTG